MASAHMEPITSAGNAEVKRLRALHERKFRRQTGLFLAEGTRICTEAVSLGWRLQRLAFLLLEPQLFLKLFFGSAKL